MKTMYRFFRFNQKQQEKTSELFLKITEALLLAILIGNIPGVGSGIGVTGTISGILVAFVSYVIAMMLYKGVKDK